MFLGQNQLTSPQPPVSPWKLKAKRRPKLKQELSLKYVLDYLSVSVEEPHLLGELCVFIPFLMFLFHGFLRRDTMEEHFAASGLKRLLAEKEIPPTRYHVGAIRDEGPDFAKTFMECDSEEDVDEAKLKGRSQRSLDFTDEPFCDSTQHEWWVRESKVQNRPNQNSSGH